MSSSRTLICTRRTHLVCPQTLALFVLESDFKSVSLVMSSSYPGLVPFSNRSRQGGDIPLSEVTDALFSDTIY
jgi:hypothetical protein